MLSILFALVLCPAQPAAFWPAPLPQGPVLEQADDPVATMHCMYEALIEGGQTPTDRAALLAFWETYEANSTPTAKYMLEKSIVLSWIDEPEESERVFERVPDEALELPYQFRNRLSAVLDVDLDRALSLMQHLASVDRDAFAEWLHQTYAFRLAPEPRSDIDIRRHLALLEQLESTDSPAFGVAKGLRAWVASLAPEATDEELRSTLRLGLEDGAACMARYRLLLVTRAAGRPETRVDALEALLELIGALEARQAMPNPDSLQHARERYVFAQACMLYSELACAGDLTRQTTWLLRAARWAPYAATAQELKAMYYEKGCLGGPIEHRSAVARALEELGQTDLALECWLEVVTEDLARLQEVRAEFERLAPDRDFGVALVAALDQHLPRVAELGFTTLEGSPWPIGDQRGRFVVLDFWGTWCGPCRADLPNIEAFHQELLKNPDRNAMVMTVACLDTREAVENFLGERNYTFPVTLDEGDIAAAFGVSGFPTKILVTPQGRWMALKPAFQGPYQDWRVLVRELMSALT